MTALLIFIGLILIILNVIAIKKQNKSFDGVLGNAMGDVKNNDIIVGELRQEFSESILELQSEIMDMKEIMEKNNKSIKNNEPMFNKNENETIIEENNHIAGDKTDDIAPIEELHNDNSSKIEEIKKLFSEGLSLDEISEVTHLGKGEVLLIKDLYIR
ncbi:DUF6115 domain-containing protein [Clostridium psychrophilum]|uniref:DUF6115 domain-containing protein n=1 Tax=Clostridium psychrophilum TaxID=132926 RepID=UPI001C0ADB37|nr:hypothetical protein [Clostridium psychrophilum]MBU3180625.1 hypothetical protein [Clostridium psychrophilum]